MTLVRNDTFGVLSIEPSGPYGLLDAVTPRSDLALWPTETAIAQTYACGDIQAVGHACDPNEVEALPAPDAIAAAVAAGTLAAGDYTVVVTALNALGETTGTPITVNVAVAATEHIEIDWDAVDGATGYNVYIGLPAGTPGFVGTTAALTFSYDGTPVPSGVAPPTVNTTGNIPAKRFDGLESLDGVHLTLQGGILCGAMSLSGEQGLAYARSLFEARESAGVEREFLRHVLAANGGSVVDLTPTAGAVNARTGLALAEGYGIAHYGGEPYIHTPATIGSMLFARGAARLGDHAETKLGNPLVVGAGYDYPSIGPDGTPAAEGTYWIYVTGRPLIARGELVLHESFNTTNNDRVVLAERGYLLSVDCMVAAINVTLEG